MTREKKEYLDPVHPGEVLRLEFMEPLDISQNKLAREIQVPPRRINEIVHGHRGITADTAMRLGRYFSVSPEFWLNLQTRYELDCVKRSEHSRIFAAIKAFKPAAAML
ncbi:MAG: HigA family addiction module antitoxin [Victivallaceae bacterium]|nr:HigA family addiction module antitoxin [Victivallaceae bacterium]